MKVNWFMTWMGRYFLALTPAMTLKQWSPVSPLWGIPLGVMVLWAYWNYRVVEIEARHD